MSKLAEALQKFENFSTVFSKQDIDEFQQYEKFLDKFTLSCLIKYMNGRIEHGSDISSVDVEKAIMEEIEDIIGYRFIGTQQK